MIYLGRNPVGLLARLPEYVETSYVINFTEYKNFDTATLFFNYTSVANVISQLNNGKYKIVFENNTNNTRAGQWIIFTKTPNIGEVQVMRIGLSEPAAVQYGVDVYENATGKIYVSTK